MNLSDIHDTVPAFAAITASTPLGRLPTRATSMFMESLTRTLDENLAHSLCSHSFIFWTFPLGCQRGVCVKKGIYEENIGGYQNLELMKDSRCLLFHRVLVPGLVIAACFTSLHWTLCAAPGHVRFGFSCSAMKTCSCLITVLQLIWRPCDVWSSAAIAKGWWPVHYARALRGWDGVIPTHFLFAVTPRTTTVKYLVARKFHDCTGGILSQYHAGIRRAPKSNSFFDKCL